MNTCLSQDCLYLVLINRGFEGCCSWVGDEVEVSLIGFNLSRSPAEAFSISIDTGDE